MSLGKRLEDNFLAGLVLVLPLVVTLFVLRILFRWTVGVVDPIVQASRLPRYTANIELAAQGLAVVIVLGSITLVGFLSQMHVVQRVSGPAGRVVGVLPVFRTIYGTVRQIASSVSDQGSEYKRVVFVEYPRDDAYQIGFVTGTAPETARELSSTGEVYAVFIPASPNPTGGRLALVPENLVYESDLSVREGIRTLMTTGMATSQQPADDVEFPGPGAGPGVDDRE